MPELMLPRTPSGMAAKKQLDDIRQAKATGSKVSAADNAAANSIQVSSKTDLSSDEFLSRKQAQAQLQKLHDYVEEKRGYEPLFNLPDPVGWRLSVLILQPPTETAGGLILTDDLTEQYAHKSTQGIVIALGDECYQDKKRFSSGPWCSVGDRILFKRYDASKHELSNGQSIGILNDTQPIAVKDSGLFVGGNDDE